MMKTLVVWLAVICGGGSVVPLVSGEAEENDTNSEPIKPVVTSISNDLNFDENGKLQSFHLVFPLESPDCPATNFHPTYGYENHAIDGEALDIVFPGYQKGECVAACLERGTDRAVAGYTMPHFHYDESKIETSFKHWFTEACTAKEVCIMNYHTKKKDQLELHWIKPSNQERILTRKIDHGERGTACISSYLGHKFETQYEGKVADSFTIEHILVKSIGVTKSPVSDQSFEKDIISALHTEWGRHHAVKRTFSPLGFAKGKLPNDVFAAMAAFFYNNRHNKVHEEWGGRGVFVNWWETDVSFIQIPWELKKGWQVRLADLVSAWAGVPVEETTMYGLRQYEEGARLLTHVDRRPTHAISLIVNVAQGNLTAPWPVEVHDHADRLHEVMMDAGDIVYYESAKNLHGRNRHLQGKNAYYVNLFTHYRPVGDGDTWHEITDQPGAPPPVIETSGECRLKPTATTDTTLPALGQVRCDDKRLGTNLSPALFQAKSPEDLIDWWRKTTPGYVERSTGTVEESEIGDDDQIGDDDEF